MAVKSFITLAPGLTILAVVKYVFDAEVWRVAEFVVNFTKRDDGFRVQEVSVRLRLGPKLQHFLPM
jgi:hypothetical protein